MDAEDLFRKLSFGAKFNLQKYHYDAQKLQLIRPKPILLPFSAKTNPSDDSNVKVEHSSTKGDEDELHLTLLGTIKSNSTAEKSSKTRKRKTKLIAAALQVEKVNRIRNQQKISVNGQNVPPPVESFEQLAEEYSVGEDIINNLTKNGYSVPTPIQMQALPIMLQNRQLLACAPTGSGKTAAFLIPIIHHLGGPRKKGFRAVIVSPTRELARQTYRECIRLSEGRKLKVCIISKATQAVSKYGPQSSQRFDILVTTPNRLVYLLKQDPPALLLGSVQWLIIDESDKLFEVGQNGFRDQLATIYQACSSSDVKRCMFSATHTTDVARWARKNLDGLISVTIGQRNTAADIVEQQLLYVGNERGKLVAFRDLVQKGLTPPVLVFVQTKERAKELFSELIYDGINVDVIHADRTQLQRDNVVRSFRKGDIWVLICTELMGRGIDFKGVNLVINYDFPPSSISYIHRIGRTGRAGHPGKAITFFTQNDTVNLRSVARIVQQSGCDIPDYLLSLKKPNKRDKRKLEKKAPKRDRISTVPLYDIKKKERLKKLIDDSKRKKQQDAGEPKRKKPKLEDK